MLVFSPLQKRLVAVALAVAATGAIVAAIALPTMWLHQRYDQYLETYTDRLTRYRRVADMRPAVEQAIKAAEKKDSKKFYLKGGSPTLAAAELQGLITRIVESNQGKVMSSQIIQPRDDGKKPAGAHAVSVSVQLGAAIIPLQLILHALETTEPFLFIDKVSVHANQGRGYKPIPGTQPEFAVQLTAHAYIYPGGNP